MGVIKIMFSILVGLFLFILGFLAFFKIFLSKKNCDFGCEGCKKKCKMRNLKK